MGERVRFCGLGILLLSCAGKAPPPQTATAVVAPGNVVTPAVPSGPPIEIVPATAARPHLLASISVGSVDKLLENGTLLVSQAVPLPMDAKGLREMLLSQAGLPADVAANLDFASPCGAVLVAIGDKGESGTVMAIPAKGQSEAQTVIAALGKPVMTRGAVTLVRSAANGSGWLYRAGNVIVLSDDLEALSRGASLALEARRAGPDDVTATIFPASIARAHGTDVPSAIALIIKQVREQPGVAKGMMGDHALEPLAALLGLIGDADSTQIGLSVDPARGLILRGRLLARPGTRLEAVAKEVRPFELDSNVVHDKASRFVVGASSLGPFSRGILDTYRERLAADKQKGSVAALAYLDATLTAMNGETSGGVWLTKDAPFLSGAFASSIKDRATAAKVTASLGAMDAAALSAFVRAQVGDQTLFEWTAKKESVGPLKALHYRIKLKKTGKTDSAGIRRFLGESFDVYWAVAGTRIAITFGHDAKGRLVSLATGKTATSETGAMADAAAAAKGRDAFYYLDFAPLLGLASKLSDEPRAAMIARGSGVPVPVVFTAGGDGVGKTWTVDLTVTGAAFNAIGALVVGGMGASK